MQLVPPAILAFALASSMPSTMIGVNALPVASPGAVRPTALRLAPSSAEASEIIKSLQAAEQKANEDPATGIEPLRAVLDQYEDLGPAVGRDAKAHEARIYALLALARAQQAVGQNAEAAQTMDEAIRVARGDTLPAKTFGPRLVELHESRRSAPENRPAGSIVVECNPACDVVLDARHAGSGSRVEVTDVPLGPHRVQVHANDGRSEGAVDEAIRLTEDASTFALTWPAEG